MVAVVVGVLAVAAVASTAVAWHVASPPTGSSARRRRIHVEELRGWSLSRAAAVSGGPPPLDFDVWLRAEERPTTMWRRVLRLLGLVVLLAAAAGALAGTAVGVARLAGMELARFVGR
ncbi:MAG: hypothetical protein M3Q23_11125 [Actinomycetota bacterium]|nr:hypothetical protein [Actinomycetota bacterium]